MIATADMPTTYGSPIYEGFMPKEDAQIVAQLRAYGGTVFGKTVTTEFAWRKPGPTVNPWNAAHTPGGSSSGSAAAVGAGIVPLALGTQTLGSVIRPAAYCGVVGYKPTHGRVPSTGVHPLSQSRDHVGFFANSVENVALAHALFVDARPEVLASAHTWAGYFAPRRPQSGRRDSHVAMEARRRRAESEFRCVTRTADRLPAFRRSNSICTSTCRS